jgi:CheY-like chemotaxis protein
MEHKVLIADDSLTIQKVIKITLSNEPFAISECSNADDLADSVSSLKPSIVLLDFNLSENKTGYDLAKEIKAASPNSQILMLYGAFDNIDESLLHESGCAYHIVKPFDGTKFINLCRTMAQDYDSNNSKSDSNDDFDFSTENEVESDIPDKIEETNDAEDWVVNQPEVEQDIPEPIEASESVEDNDLDTSLEDWGMEVPGVINADGGDFADVPGIIEQEEIEVSSSEVTEQSIPEPIQTANNDDETLLPSNDDLEYPDFGDMSASDNVEEEEVKTPASDDLDYPDLDNLDTLEVEAPEDKKEPQLTPASQLNEVEEKPIEVSQGGTDTEEALKSLESEISDELAEDDLWAADEYEDTHQEIEENYVDKEVVSHETHEPQESEDFKTMDLEDLPQIEPHSLEKVVDNTEDEDSSRADDTPEDFPDDIMEEDHTSLFEGSEEPKAPASDDLDYPDLNDSYKKIDEAVTVPEKLVSDDFQEKLQNELTEKLTPIVEEYAKEYCKNSIEKIAWEIIPDLAENIIKKEIQKISDSILDN